MRNLMNFLAETAEYINKTYPEYNVSVETTKQEIGGIIINIQKMDGEKISISYSVNVDIDDLNYVDEDDEHTPVNYAKYLISLFNQV